jgi:hypothetical protein
MLRHAALELRRCIEAVVYEKLSAYRDRLPAGARRWQAPQAFKALIAIEPEAAHSTTIGFAWQKEEGVPATGPFHLLGVDRRPDVGWLTKTYNKLGNLLHAEFPFGPTSLSSRPDEASVFLTDTIAVLEPLVEASLTTSLAVTVTFDCSVCGSVVVASRAGVESNHFAVCLNPECEARYEAQDGESGLSFVLEKYEGKCPTCGEPMVVPTCKIRAGYELTCVVCQAKTVIGFCLLREPQPTSE